MNVTLHRCARLARTTQGKGKVTSMLRTISELRNTSDREVLACIAELKANGVQTKDFQNYFKTEYSYSLLTGELSNRGYSQQWVKNKPKVVSVKMEKTARMNLNMTKECREKYEAFLADKAYNFIHTSAALMSYIEDYESGKVKTQVEV